jgi:hypothetical protein
MPTAGRALLQFDLHRRPAEPSPASLAYSQAASYLPRCGGQAREAPRVLAHGLVVLLYKHDLDT